MFAQRLKTKLDTLQMKTHYSFLAKKQSKQEKNYCNTFCGNLFLQFDITTNTNLVCLLSIGTYSKAVFACRLQTKLDSLLMKIHYSLLATKTSQNKSKISATLFVVTYFFKLTQPQIHILFVYLALSHTARQCLLKD